MVEVAEESVERVLVTGLSIWLIDGNGWPLSRPEALSASYNAAHVQIGWIDVLATRRRSSSSPPALHPKPLSPLINHSSGDV